MGSASILSNAFRVITPPFFWEIDALIAISTRHAGRMPPNNMALATVSVSRSTMAMPL
jgi:hypothetical protein